VDDFTQAMALGAAATAVGLVLGVAGVAAWIRLRAWLQRRREEAARAE
jgi:hypothetical protein